MSSDSEEILDVPLSPAFRYVHEPLLADDLAVPFVGASEYVEALKGRILHSRGGAFLVTGFRGVGKTTVVRRALAEITGVEIEGARVLPITLNIARPMTTNDVLFEVIRRLFERLIDERFLDMVQPEVAQALLLAYMRTSMSVKQTDASSLERTTTVGLGSVKAIAEAVAPGAGRFAPSLSWSRRKTTSLATEASFLAYSDADVEHDFLRIVELLSRGGSSPSANRWRVFRRRRDKPTAAHRRHLVVVLDELDKLTSTPEGLAAMEDLLSGMKNLLATHGAHFVFVAGPDVHDRALIDSQRGNSVYASVFGWQIYIPCLWGSSRALIDELMPGEGQGEALDELDRYLAFKSRGVPRLLLQEFNALVGWSNERPRMTIPRGDVTRIKFYSRLQHVLGQFFAGSKDRWLLSIAIDEDRRRLSAYYATDWILRSEGKPFTVDDIVAPDQPLAIEPLLRATSARIEPLVDTLVEHAILEVARGRSADQTIIGDVPEVQQVSYRLTEDVRRTLYEFVRTNERERAAPSHTASVHGAEPLPVVSFDATRDPDVVGAERYELGRVLGQGAMGTVYEGYDRIAGRKVAVKVLEGTAVRHDPNMRQRFRREAELAASLSHPLLVSTHDVIEEADGRQGLVMQLVEGETLRTAMDHRRFTPNEAVSIALALAEALTYLDKNGIYRLDLKPQNIMLQDDLTPIVIDFGLIKTDRPSGFATMTGAPLGTPRYMAPEQIQGGEVDIRSDLYALGLILYELIVGRPLRDDAESEFAMLYRIIKEDVDISDLPSSVELRAVLTRALERQPEDRFQTPAEMKDALEAVPEASTSE